MLAANMNRAGRNEVKMMSNTGMDIQARHPAVDDDSITTSAGLETGFTGSVTNIATLEDIPPDGGYGWMLLLRSLRMDHTRLLRALWAPKI
jgi:hypothetical protein